MVAKIRLTLPDLLQGAEASRQAGGRTAMGPGTTWHFSHYRKLISLLLTAIPNFGDLKPTSCWPCLAMIPVHGTLLWRQLATQERWFVIPFHHPHPEKGNNFFIWPLQKTWSLQQPWQQGEVETDQLEFCYWCLWSIPASPQSTLGFCTLQGRLILFYQLLNHLFVIKNTTNKITLKYPSDTWVFTETWDF